MNTPTPSKNETAVRLYDEAQVFEGSRPSGLLIQGGDEILRLERELAAVTEQRERLADLVKQFIYILDITEESDGGRLFHPTNITSCRAGDLQKAGQLVEALRRASRNQPTP